MKKLLAVGIVIIALSAFFWLAFENEVYIYRRDGFGGAKDEPPSAGRVFNDTSSPALKERVGGSLENLDADNLPKHVKACIRFWMDMNFDFAKAIIDETDGSVSCVIEVNDFTTIPNREAYSAIEQEAKSLGIPVTALKSEDVRRVFSWKYNIKRRDDLREILWQGRDGCIDNPHQSICRLSTDNPILPRLDQMPKDFKVPGLDD